MDTKETMISVLGSDFEEAMVKSRRIRTTLNVLMVLATIGLILVLAFSFAKAFDDDQYENYGRPGFQNPVGPKPSPAP